MRASIKSALTTLAIALTSVTAFQAAHAAQRLPKIDPANYNDAQKAEAEKFLEARKTPVFGPFEPLMYSPDLMTLSRSMGDYLRYKPSIGTKLSELAILVTAKNWDQDYEWYVHQPIALKVGISQQTTDAIAKGVKPKDMDADQALVYQFAWELNHNKSVSDKTYAAAEERFGQQGVVDLAGICGYYSFLAMELNMAQYPLPAGGKGIPR
ncbi:MAG TPA: carboxymuconolactone decarboxylase family protein [Limnobacter sp.]|uniref:carboxymuconolactone decarboxylase family protein n=1 Tax=Limnobacter sp. TaxID=2003368 RepID=UPI002ED8735A